MGMLLVLTFANETGAQESVERVQGLQKQQLMTISDAALVIRKEDGRVKVKQVNRLVGAGALGGAFWGLLVRQLFWESWLSPTGAVEGRIVNYGIDDDFIAEVVNAIKPGYSAFLMMVEYLADGTVLDKLAAHNATLYHTNLKVNEMVKLREAFGVVDEL
jgi:uncharacterized membrane protein